MTFATDAEAEEAAAGCVRALEQYTASDCLTGPLADHLKADVRRFADALYANGHDELSADVTEALRQFEIAALQVTKGHGR
jgi:hypothetical protein